VSVVGVALSITSLAFAGESTVTWAKPPVGPAWAAGSGVNVRAEPSPGATIVRTLAMGAPVVPSSDPAGTLILAGPLTLGELTAPWLRVGPNEWVWSGALTTARVEADLDADGDREVHVVAWRSDHHLVVRTTVASWPPERPAEEIDLGTFGDIEGPLDTAHLTLTSASETGVPMLRVVVPGREMCASGTRTRYVWWSGKRLVTVLEATDWADAPIWTYDELTFDPAAKSVVKTNRRSEDAEVEEITTQRFVWDGATFTPVGAPTHTTRKVQ
jgi:hypothetical protein